MNRVTLKQWTDFKRYAVTHLHLKPDTTLPDTIRKLRYLEKHNVDLTTDRDTLEHHVDNYIFTRMETGLTRTGANNYYKALNRWTKYRELRLHFTLYKEPRTPQYTPTPRQVRRCIQQWHKRNRAHKRNRTMLVALAASGLRISEFTNLELQDIDYERCTITVRHGKGGEGRTIYVDKKVIRGKNYPSIKNYVDHWRIDSHSTALWTTRKGEMTIDYARKIVKQTGRHAGIPQLHPHALRRFFAVTMLQAGVSIKAIQRQLGHTRLDTTDIYLQGITDADIRLSIETADIPDPLRVKVKYQKPVKHADKGVYAESPSINLNGPGGMYENPFIEHYKQPPVLQEHQHGGSHDI